MKQIYIKSLIAAAALASVSGMQAQESSWTQVGNSDYSSGWWTAFSDLYTVEAGKKITVELYNYNSGIGYNWNNWLMVFTTNTYIGDDNYAEYGAVRCDNYGWGDYFDTASATYTNTYDWTDFVSLMNGAHVYVTVLNHGDKIEIQASTTDTGENSYSYRVVSTEGDFSDLGFFFSVEAAYIAINPETTVEDIESDNDENKPYGDDWNIVGNSDYSSGWWTAFSGLYTVEAGKKITVELYNYNSGTGYNWNNWLMVFTTNTYIGDDNYAEYGAVRCDNYGWGDYFDTASATYTNTYDWTDFVSLMNGAHVYVTVLNHGDKIGIQAVTTKDDNQYEYNVVSTEGDFSDLGFFFSVEAAYIAINPEAAVSDISSIVIDMAATEGDAEYFDLQGRKLQTPASGQICIRKQGAEAKLVVK